MKIQPKYKIQPSVNIYYPYKLIVLDDKGREKWSQVYKTTQDAYKAMKSDIRFNKTVNTFDEDGCRIKKISLYERFIIGSLQATFVWEKVR